MSNVEIPRTVQQPLGSVTFTSRRRAFFANMPSEPHEWHYCRTRLTKGALNEEDRPSAGRRAAYNKPGARALESNNPDFGMKAMNDSI